MQEERKLKIEQVFSTIILCVERVAYYIGATKYLCIFQWGKYITEALSRLVSYADKLTRFCGGTSA
jgi:hypothetical protein